MGLFASNAMLTGTTIKDQLADVTATTMELNNQNGIALSVKDIQEGLAKTSKAALFTAGIMVNSQLNSLQYKKEQDYRQKQWVYLLLMLCLPELLLKTN